MLLNYGDCNVMPQPKQNRVVMSDGTVHIIDNPIQFAYSGNFSGATQSFTSLGESVTIQKNQGREIYLDINIAAWGGQSGFCSYLFSEWTDLRKVDITFSEYTMPISAGYSCFVGMFNSCSLLSDINSDFNIPQSIVSFGDDALGLMFNGCESLRLLPSGFNIPVNITSVGSGFAYNMFRGCVRLESIPNSFNIPQGITSIGNSFLRSMFQNCTRIQTMPGGFNIPQGVTSYPDYFCSAMFAGSGIYTLPNGFRIPNVEGADIGNSVLYLFASGCPNLFVLPESFTLPNGNYGTIGSSFCEDAFSENPNLRALSINFRLPESASNAPSITNYCRQMVRNCPNIRNPISGEESAELKFINGANSCFGGTTQATPVTPLAGTTVYISNTII